MIKVKDWNGEDVSFDETMTTEWLAKSFKLPRSIAREVARRVSDRLGDQTVEMRELFVLGARLSIQEVARFKGFPNSARGAPPILAALDPATLAGAAGKVIEILAGQFAKGGWEDEGTAEGFKKEFGSGFFFGDDATAPRVIRATTAKLDCCPPGGPKGVKLTVKVRVTDDSGSLGNDSGVRKIRVVVLDSRNPGFFTDDGAAEKILLKDDSARTEDDELDVELEVCIPCVFIVNKIAYLGIRVTDNDDNERFVVRTFDVSSKVDTCCA